MNKRTFFAILLLAGLCPGSSRARPDEKAQPPYYEDAMQSYRRGDLAKAAALFDKALTESPSFLPAYRGRALTRQLLGDREGMEADLSRLLKIRTIRGAQDALLRGDARLMAGDPRAAMEDFEDAILKDPQDAQAYVGRGRVRRAAADMAGAFQDLSQALKLSPDMLTARYHRARVLHESGHPEKALEELTRALQANPRFFLPYALVGVILAERSDFERAQKAYSKALALNPAYAPAYLGRAAARWRSGDAAGAAKDFDAAVRAAPKDCAPYYNRAEARLLRGERDAAIEDFQQAAAMRPEDPRTALQLGKRLSSFGLFPEAARVFSAALSGTPEDAFAAEVLIERSAALQAQDRSNDAKKDLDEAVNLSAASAAALTARARFFMGKGDSRRAEEDLRRALETSPRWAPALCARGSLHVGAGRYDEALKDYSAALTLDATIADAYNNRGALYANVFHDMDKALSDLEKAVELSGDRSAYLLNLAAARIQRHDFRSAAKTARQALDAGASSEDALRLQALALFSLGERPQALRLLDQALAKTPRNAGLLAAKGALALRMRDYPQALADLDAALKLDPEDVRARLDRGLAQGGMGEYKKALKDFEQAQRYDPGSAEAHACSCQALRLLERTRDASEECRQALELDGRNIRALMQNGLLSLQTQEYAQAVRDLLAGDRLSPAASAPAALARSAALAALRRHKEADAAYREALGIDPSARNAEMNFGETPSPGRNYATLIDALSEELASQDARTAAMHVVRGDAFSSDGQYDKALKAYDHALGLDANLASAHVGRGLALLEKPDPDGAEKALRRALAVSPQDAQAQAALVDLLTTRRRYPEALRALSKALSLRPQAAELYLKAGNLRYFMGNKTLARDNYLLALRYDPRSAAARNGLGLCLFANKSYAEAVEEFSRAAALMPEADRFYRNRAAAYVNAGSFAEAAQDYRMAAELTQDPAQAEEYRKHLQSALARATRTEGKTPR
ncbi:MAG: tetratricopeptide repeat protein [Elusimicrobiota bacterium]